MRRLGGNLVGAALIGSGGMAVFFRDDVVELIGAILLFIGGGVWFDDYNPD